jgi:ComF family protein
LRDIIHAYKYEGRRSLAPPLGRLMREAGGALLDGADYVIPVPLHPWRRLRRGFNQAADLARELDRPVVHALWRVHATLPQMGLPARARRTNVRGAFILSPWAPSIKDRAIVLVDDVRTTGATLNACATLLRNAGAREVRALTVAIAEFH